MPAAPGASYRGRLAPSPTGFLHLGHAQTFWIAAQRAKAPGATLLLRIEDLDRARSRPEFVTAIVEDLRWLEIAWDEGPFFQSKRTDLYAAALGRLMESGKIYRCVCSRQDVRGAAQAPHAGDDEPIYPGTCRDGVSDAKVLAAKGNFSWRFRVSDGEVVSFADAFFGGQKFVAGRDFGDFVVWSRRDGIDTPAYQLAVAVDDAAMGVTEVVRGADLLLSTARQLLLYRALGLEPPAFCHCPLLTNAEGARLAKRDAAMSIRALREQGLTPEKVKQTRPSQLHGYG